MSDYKRLISYIYNYEKGMKQNNVGFAKIELRDSQCKLSINIKASSLNGQKLRMYLFYRQDNKMIQILLSEATVTRGILEWKGITSARNIMNTGHTFEEMAGMLLYYSLDKYYATEWDDQPVYLDKLNEFGKLQEEKSIGIEKVEPRIITVPKDEITYLKEKKEAEEAVVKSQEEIVKSILDSIDNGIEIFMNMQHKDDELKIAEIANSVEESSETINQEITEDTAKLVGYRFMKWYRKNETCFDKESASTEDKPIDQVIKIINDVEKEKESIATLGDEQLEDIAATEELLAKKNDPLDLFDYDKEEEFNKWEKHIEEENKRKISTAERILSKYPALKPFDDEEIVSCVRIEPGDIGLFPIENWVLGNNSFLLHGYYNFRHLIFAKKISEEGTEYILGIPGIYQNREKFMAKMFGFTQFKAAKTVDKVSGEFGYWYVKINM